MIRRVGAVILVAVLARLGRRCRPVPRPSRASARRPTGDVCDVHVIRKRLYLRDDQELALKERAATTGVSEAELVRQAVDTLLAVEGDVTDADLGELLEAADRAAAAHRFPAGWRLDRDELHDRP